MRGQYRAANSPPVGIGVHELSLLEREQPLGEVLMLGRQRINVQGRPDRGAYADELLRELGATSVASLDYSDFEGATYTGDLNGPIDLGRQFDTVIDYGTSEHVFDVASSLRNCIRLCRIGGKILHALPANGDCGHGLYQLSPELFLALYSDRNGFTGTEVFLYDLIDDRHWWRVKPGGRIMANSLSNALCLVRTVKSADVATLAVNQGYYEEAWNSDAALKVTGKYERAVRLLRRTPFLPLVVALYRGYLAPTAITRFNPSLERVDRP